MDIQDQLLVEKQENRRVTRVLDEIVQEVEEKAPILKRQREEYESMQRSMNSLCAKLEQARTVSGRDGGSGRTGRVRIDMWGRGKDKLAEEEVGSCSLGTKLKKTDSKKGGTT